MSDIICDSPFRRKGEKIRSMKQLEIIYKDSRIAVVCKPAGVPSQEDKTKCASVLRLLSERFDELDESSEVYPVHRLDRGVGGLMVVARTKSSAASLSRAVTEGELRKEYLAITKGRCEGGEYTDYLFKDSTTNKSYAVKTERRGAKLARLDAIPLETKEYKGRELTLIRVRLYTGRHHQIRCQLATRGTPIIGDKKYGGQDSECKNIALFSSSLKFSLDGEKFEFTLCPNTEDYPFSLFREELTQDE